MKSFRVVDVKKNDKNIEFTINVGKNDGVKVNDKFMVYELGENILDPKNCKELEKLEKVKAMGKVTQVKIDESIVGCVKIKGRNRVITSVRDFDSKSTMISHKNNIKLQSESDNEIETNLTVRIGDYVKYIP